MSQWLILHTDSLKPKTNWKSYFQTFIVHLPQMEIPTSNSLQHLPSSWKIILRRNLFSEMLSIRAYKLLSLLLYDSRCIYPHWHRPNLLKVVKTYPIGSQLLIILELYRIGLLGHSPRTLEDLIEITVILNWRSSRDHYDPKLNSSGISDSSGSFRPRARPHNFSVQGSSPQKSKEICLMFNKFKSSTCELPNNQCANHHLHKCSFCHKWGCKACNHRANGPSHFNKSKGQEYQGHAHVVSNLSGQGSGNGDESSSSSSHSEPTSNPELTTVLSNM